jgi:hypothetical protein
VSAVPRHGLGQPPVACWVGRVAWVTDGSTTNPPGRVQVASKATTWERTSSAGQGAGRRSTALTDRLQQG